MFRFFSLDNKCDAAVGTIFPQKLREIFLADEPDACEISFVMDDENSAIFKIWVISVEKPRYPFQIFGLFLRNSYELSRLLAFGKLPRRLHDVKNQDFIFIDKLPKIAAEISRKQWSIRVTSWAIGTKHFFLDL